MATLKEILQGVPQAARTVKSLIGNATRPIYDDYAQLWGKGSNLRNDANLLKGKIGKLVPPQSAFNSPYNMSEWSLKAALNAPMGLSMKPKDILTLYHGSHEPISEIKRFVGPFDGLFTSADMQAAKSHGDVVTKFDVDLNKIGDDFSDNYDDVINLIKERYPEASMDQIEDYLYPAISDDTPVFSMNHDELKSITGMDDIGEIAWQLQNDRGMIGKELGYDAIKMKDEHGTSYFLPYGTKANIKK